MSAFASKDVVTIRDEKNWEPWEGVTIKAKMSLADEEFVNNHMAKLTDPKKKNPMDQNLLIGTTKRKLLERMIVSWTFTDANKNPVLVTPETIADLDKGYADFIYEEINKRNPSMSEEEQQDFFPDANGSTPEKPHRKNS